MNSVAILSALPESLEDVQAGASKRSKDYIRTQLLIRLHTPESAWEIMRPTLVDDAHALFSWCRATGMTVFQHAGLSELRNALANFDLVIILAHWKGPNVHFLDLPEHKDKLVQIAAKIGSTDLVHGRMSPLALRKSLKSVVNHKIKSWLDWVDLTPLGDGDVVVGNYYGQCLAREHLNETIGDLMVPGARLELSDGLWSAKDIAACFPDGWDDICDFFCCRSIYLSEVVKTKTRQGLVRADARFLKPKKVFNALKHNLRAVVAGDSYLAAAHKFDDDDEED